MLKPCGAIDGAERAHRVLRERRRTRPSRQRQLGVVGDVPVRARPSGGRSCTDTGSAPRTRVRRARRSAPSSSDRRRRRAERAVLAGVAVRRLALALDVGHPMRRPQPAEVVGFAGEGSSRARCESFAGSSLTRPRVHVRGRRRVHAPSDRCRRSRRPPARSGSRCAASRRGSGRTPHRLPRRRRRRSS